MPRPTRAKPYVLMRDTLADSDRVAIVKVTLRSREALGVLRAMGDVLVVHTLLWPEEVRDAESLAPQTEVSVRKQEIAMASSYIDSLAADFDPSQFTDEYKAAVEELVEAKTAGREVTGIEPQGNGGEVIDLVEALRANVQAAKAKRAGQAKRAGAAQEDAEQEDAGAQEKKPAKRAAARGGTKPGQSAASGTGTTRRTTRKKPA